MFSELIVKAAELAGQPFSEDMQHYYILLIITDGVVNDKSLTVAKSVGVVLGRSLPRLTRVGSESSKHPISPCQSSSSE